MGSSEKRAEMWNSMLDAEMNELYWADEAQRQGNTDRLLKIVIALSSSGTTLALFAPITSHPNTAKALTALVTALSLIHTNMYSTARLKLVTSLAARWKEIAIEYCLLWAELDEDGETLPKTWKEFESVCRREKQIDESAFKINEKRLLNAFNRVRVTRGSNER